MARDGRLGVGIAVVALLLGLSGDFLFRGEPLGLNVLLFAAAFVLALAVLLRLARAPLHQGRRWMAAPLLLFSAAFLWHDSPLLTAVNLCALAGAVALGALRRTDPHVHRAGVTDYAAGFGAAGFSAFAGAVHLLHKDIDWNAVDRGLRTPRAGAVARGLAIGAPLVALFGGLFLAADAVFRGLVTSAVPSTQHPIPHLLTVSAFGWLAAGLLRDLLEPREEARLISPAAVAARPGRLSLGATELTVVLCVLDLLFLAFVLVQLRYFFGGQELVEARAHLTYAQYARHGFFELVAVSLLVLPLLLAVDALLRRERHPRGVWVVRVLSGVLLALVLVVMASALQRMRLYAHQYGLTELRIYTTGVMVWLAAVFAWFAVTVLRGRRHLFAIGALVTGFAATAALNVLNPDALIARTNLSRPHVDAHYVGSLSDDAVPVLLERLPAMRPDQRRVVAAELLRRSAKSAGGWAAFNISRSRAHAALLAHRAELRRLAR